MHGRSRRRLVHGDCHQHDTEDGIAGHLEAEFHERLYGYGDDAGHRTEPGPVRLFAFRYEPPPNADSKDNDC